MEKQLDFSKEQTKGQSMDPAMDSDLAVLMAPTKADKKVKLMEYKTAMVMH